jgi:hypothetical protein
MKTGIELIAEERATHPYRGYDHYHDEDHTAFQLSSAGTLYAIEAQNKYFKDHTHYDDMGDVVRLQYRELESKKWILHDWPWEDGDKRDKHGIVKLLVKAAAFYAAEIDRLRELDPTLFEEIENSKPQTNE